MSILSISISRVHLLTLRSSLFIYSPWYNHTIFDDTSEFSVEKSYLIIVAALKMFPDPENEYAVLNSKHHLGVRSKLYTYTKQTVLSNIIGYSKWNCLFVRSIKSFYNIRWSMVETIHWLLVHNVPWTGCSILYHTGSRKSPDRQGLAPAVNTLYSTADNMRVANISAVPFITRCRCVTRDYKWR